MIFSIAASAVLPAWAGCPAAEGLIAQYGISFSGFKQTLPRVSAPAESPAQASELVTIALPNKNGNVSDGYVHSALINKNLKRAWILRTGGFAGVYEWYGPVALPSSDFAGCIGEPGRLPQPSTATR
ncbi:hypothetical protein [Collimonas arenae]|uniref:hypothetical protein n=1 Tax=Collimonas arenae TaxID=279058 RepID=UPI0012E974E0|nr:hypothetical protein [Collimonas arenae]